MAMKPITIPIRTFRDYLALRKIVFSIPVKTRLRIVMARSKSNTNPAKFL
jgi:hypothetical protein